MRRFHRTRSIPFGVFSSAGLVSLYLILFLATPSEAETQSFVNVVTDFAATGNGKQDDTKAIQSALDSGASRILIPAGEYKITSRLRTHPGQVIEGGGIRNSTLRKEFHGTLLTLAPWVTLRDLRLVGLAPRFTGGGVVITEGANTSDIPKQGHQAIFRCSFEDFTGYAVEYSLANAGWMSTIEESTFSRISAPAAVKWPDEPALGGNRQVIGCYSDSPLVNVGGADNGIISRNTVGGRNAPGQGLLFPALTAHRAKKIIIAMNRFAIADGTINIRGVDVVFSDNIVAGSVQLESDDRNDGASNCRISLSNIVTGSLSDLSNTVNQLDSPVRYFELTWAAAQAPPRLGDGDQRCEYSRHSIYTTVRCSIVFGRDTRFGEGAWTFSSPTDQPPKTTTPFVGTASLNGRAGTVRVVARAGKQVIALFDASGAPVTATTPLMWSAGDTVVFEITYRRL